MELFNAIRRFFSKSQSIFQTVSGGNGHSSQDRTLRCLQCRKDFKFEAGEQAFFRERGFQEPKRCPRCRKQNKHRSRRG